MSLHTFQSLAMWDWVYWKSFAPPPPPLDPPLLKKKTFCCNTVTCRNILIWVSKILAAWWQKVVRIGWFRSIGVNEACNQLDIAILACFPCHMGKGLHISKYEFACAYVTISWTLWGALGHFGTLWDTMRHSGTLLDSWTLWDTLGKGLFISKYEFACAYVTLSGTLPCFFPWTEMRVTTQCWDPGLSLEGLFQFIFSLHCWPLHSFGNSLQSIRDGRHQC